MIGQTIDRFESEGITDIGVIQANHPRSNPSALVQICSIQTLKRRGIQPAAFVIIDEVHIWHDAYADWMHDLAWARVPSIGLSATPCARASASIFKN